MRRSTMRWAMGVIAPWCLGMGMLVSFTADAGQGAVRSGSLAALTARAAAQPDDLVPLQSLALTGDLGNYGMRDERPPVRLASFEEGESEDFHDAADEIEPRTTLKPDPGAMPVVDRSRKGDPAIGLRPTFDSALRHRGGVAGLQERLMIGPHDDAMPAASFSLQDQGDPLDGAASFAPWGEGENPQDAREDDDENTAPRAGAISMLPAALKERLAQGATPPVPRAEALSSQTPAPADGAPIVATFSPGLLRKLQQAAATPDSSIAPRAQEHPNFAALLVGERGARERKCLAEAVYFESRSEPEDGQAAVAQVVLNRATSGLYPASICGVVYQNRSHYMACQFSFACEGKSLRITEPDAWARAVRIADSVVEGRTYLSDVGGATHYHANYVRPGWARRLVKMDVIGHHVFYKLKPGQT